MSGRNDILSSEGNMEAKVEQNPTMNTNFVLSVNKDGSILYSNEAGNPLLNEWDLRVGEKLPSYFRDIVQRRRNVEKNIKR